MSDEGVGQDGRLATLAADLSASSKVEKAIMTIPGAQLSVDFREATAMAKTRTTPLMAHLLMASLPLLHDLSDERHEALGSFLSFTESGAAAREGGAEDLLTLLAQKLSFDPQSVRESNQQTDFWETS